MISKRHLLIPILIAVTAVLVLVGAVGTAIYTAANKTEASKTPTKFEVSLPATKTGFQSLDSHIIGGSLNVSGQLKTDGLQVVGGIVASNIAVSGAASAGSLTLLPSDNSPRKAGQLYVSTDGSLNYYNGTAAVNIGTPALSASNAVLSLQGQTGAVSLSGGAGIAINGTTITNNGVTTIGGATGNVALGTGLELVNNTLTSNAIRSATSLSSDILVATDASGNLTISSSGSSLGGMIALAPTTAQADSSNVASISVNKTGTGNLIQLSTGATPVNRFVVDQSGAIVSGSIGFSQVTGVPTIVNSIGGASGAVTLGSGLVMVGGQLSATATAGGVASITGTTDQVIVSGGSNAVLSLPQSIAVSSTPTFAGLTLSSALAVASGGTGATSASGARTNLGVAASGVNNDITQLSGLTTALSVAQGGTGVNTLTQNGVLIGNSSSSVSGVTAASAGQCLISTAGAPSFQTCPGAGGVASVNNLTGALTIEGASAGSVTTAGNTITLQDATANTKGLASFNSNNLVVVGGVVNTIQNIATTAAPTFAGLTLSSALSVANGGTGSTSATGARASLGVAASGINSDITQLNGLTAINPTAALAVGGAGQNLTLQGASTSLSANAGGSTTTLTFAAPTANVTYRLQTAAAGTYDVCTTTGNCAGIGGDVTTAGGTVNSLAKFTNTGAIGNSNISDNGTVVTVSGPLAVSTITPTSAATFGATTQSLVLQGSSTSLTSTSAGITNTLTFATPSGSAKTIIIPNASGTVALSATGALSLDSSGNLSCPTCLTSGGGATGGVSSLNSLNGALTIASITPSSILTSGSSITIQDASSTVKGLASFNATNLVVSNGAVNTIQGISTSASPTFAGLTLTSGLGVASGGTGVTAAPTAGQLLIGNGAGYTLNTLTAGTGIAITNGVGGITIDSTVIGGCPTCATQALNNLSGVALNTSLLPGVTNTVDMGSSSLAFRNGYLAGALQVGSLDAASAAALTIGATNATAINLNQNTTLAANKNLTITGGATGTRPLSPTAGMLYYDSTTNQLLQYNGTKWTSDRSTSTKIVAASNSSQAAKDAADYVATGTGDQATINAALSAAAGGSVYLMEGTYNETAAISVPNNTTLAGAGAGTLITIPNAQNGTYNAIVNTDASTGTRVTIRDLRIDGNSANQSSGTMNGVYLTNIGSGSGSTAHDGARVTNVTASNMYGGSGIVLYASRNNTITGATTQGNGAHGIYVYGTSYTTITGSIEQGNVANGLYLYSSTYDTITGNTAQGNDGGIVFYAVLSTTVTGNTVQGNTTNGINLTFASSNTVTGNTSYGNGYGIYLLNNSNNNTVSSNNVTHSTYYGIDLEGSSYDTVTGNTTQNDSTGFSLLNATNNTLTGNTVSGNTNGGMYLSGSKNNVISGNEVYDSGGDTRNAGIQLASASNQNSVTGNDISDTSCTTSCYAIYISATNATGNYLSNNHHTGTADNTSTISDFGTGTIYSNQPDGAGNLINKAQGGSVTIGASTAAASLTLQGGLASTALPTPAAPTLTTSGTSGSTTYGYRVSALDGLGETLASTETTIAAGNATLNATNMINITWLPVGGAYQYKIYRSTSAGTPATTGLISTVAGNVTTISDTGLSASGAAAAANTTGSASFAGMLQGASLSTAGTSSLVGAVTLGAASATTGQLKLANAASAFVGTLQVASLSQNTTYTLPVSSGPTDTICLQTLANCSGGVSVIGSLDGGTANANGATISGATIYLQSASASFAGLVNTGTQTFAGAKTFNSSVTVAASQSLTLIGDTTAARPASPTAGMLYYDTTTNQLLQYNGTKWVGDRSTSTKIVAASNSSQAAKDAADYVATGSGDQATINTALTAASGGLVYLMEGTYNETATISIPNNTTLAGAGAGTLITVPNAQNGSYNVITNTDTSTGTRVTVRDLRVDGNKANQTSGSMQGIYLSGMGAGTGSTARDGAKVMNVTVRTVYGSTAAGIGLSGSFNNTLTGNTLLGNGSTGISISSSSHNTVDSNNAQGNGFYGINISSSANNTVTGNTTQGNALAGIAVNGASSGNTLTGNVIQGGASYGIYLDSSTNNTITGNTIPGSGSNGIRLYLSSGNNINGNKIHDSSGSSFNNGIQLDSNSTGNSITDNDITDTGCTSTCYAINISGAGSSGNYLANNHHSGTAANQSTINDTGTGTIYANQPDGAGNLINKSQGGGQTIGASAATASLSLQGGLASTALPTPAAATLSTSGTAGSTTYGYRVSALDGLGETLASTETTIATGNATLTGTNKINITWLPVGGAYQYKVYRSTSGGTPATTGLIATVAGNVSTISDTGLAASGTVAAANTTGGASFTGVIQGSSATLSGTLSVTGATSLGQLTVTGTSLFKNTADSTTAFQIQKSDASVLFAADTTNMKVTIAKVVVTGDITVNGHIVTGGSTPTIAAGAATCTTPTLNVSGNDTAGTLTLTTGTGCSAGGTMATVTFNKPFGSAPHVIFTPTTAASAGLGIYNGASSMTTFTIDSSVTPVDATTYTFNYITIQ